MHTALMPPARGRSSRALEGMSWIGVIAGLLLVSSALGLPGRRVAYASFGPSGLTAWVQAITGAVGLVIAAANGAAVAWHRRGRRPRRPPARPHRGPCRPEVRPHGG